MTEAANLIPAEGLKLQSHHFRNVGTHITISIIDGDGSYYCGNSWCGGACGYPALVTVRLDGRELKAYSSQVAVGPVWQLFRSKWVGAKVFVQYLPELEKSMWW